MPLAILIGGLDYDGDENADCVDDDDDNDGIADTAEAAIPNKK